jgi:hypothetical protein
MKSQPHEGHIRSAEVPPAPVVEDADESLSSTTGDAPHILIDENAPPPETWNPFVLFYRFWCRPVRVEPLAAFRICLGITILLSTLLSVMPHLDFYLDPETGLCPPDSLLRPDKDKDKKGEGWLQWSNRFCVILGPVSLPPKNLLQLWPLNELAATDAAEWVGKRWKTWGDNWEEWAKKKEALYLFFYLWIVSVALMTVGLYTRTSTIVAWTLTVSFQHRMYWLNNGGDALFRSGLFYLMLMPSGKVWSLDYLWRRWWAAGKAHRMGVPLAPPRPIYVPPWSLRLAQIQICMVYLFTGLVKFMVDFGTRDWLHNDWIDGQAVYWVLNDLSLNRFTYESFPIPRVICALLSWLTLIFEIGFPLFVCFRVLRPWLLLGGVAFHLGIWFHTEVGFFSLVTISWYPLFLSGEFLSRMVTGKKVNRQDAESAKRRRGEKKQIMLESDEVSDEHTASTSGTD